MSDREESTEEQAASQPGSVHGEEQQDAVADGAEGVVEEAGGVVEENQPSTDEQAPVEEQTQENTAEDAAETGDQETADPAAEETQPSPAGSRPGSKQSNRSAGSQKENTDEAADAEVSEQNQPPPPQTPEPQEQDAEDDSVHREMNEEVEEEQPQSENQAQAEEESAQEWTSSYQQEPVIPAPPPPAPQRERVPSASPEDNVLPNTLNMVWSFGLNKNVPVLNLTDDSRYMVAYACAHTGVIYDYATEKQTLLQGHSNAISSTCVSGDKRWLATADRGYDSMITVWDTYTGIPVRTIFDPHPDGGIEALAMTPDAKYIASLSAGETQTFAIWDWTVEGDTPVCTAELDPSYGVQSFILFNPEDINQVVTNSETQVIFYSWSTSGIEYFAPPLTDDDFNKPVGKFNQSIFLSNSTRALTATSLGNLVVWDTNKPLTKVVSSEVTPDKKALKLVKLQERGISVITTTDKFIVMGDTLGHVKFFDQTLKLVNWYQDFHLGPINSLSFRFFPEFIPEHVVRPGSDYPPDATIAARQFVIRDFVVGTSTAVCATVTTDGTDVQVIHRDHDAAVHAMAAHPSEARIAVGSYSGLLKIWDYEKKEAIISRWFDKGQMIRCCEFDSTGQYLAVGFMNGIVRILDGASLEDVIGEPFRYARDAITHVAFSHDNQYFASADAEFTVTVFKAQPGASDPWSYMGRYRAHYKLIVDIMFGVQLDSDQPRLLSLGEDRLLVEYDLENSNQDEVRVMSSDRIEQSATPYCMAWYPPVTKESFVCTANDQFKFKLYNSTTKMCRRTLLGPTYGTPIQKIIIIPTSGAKDSDRYLAYITTDKVGINKLPLDGNPHNAMALIAHPEGVANLICSHDGKHMFTAGGRDATVHMWTINLNALEAQAKLGGEDLIPFYGLLDGGRDGELFRELEDYFYYAQIRSQGVNTMEQRSVSTKIPLSEIPFVMRAMGFYPSEQEIEDMLNEVKYSNYVESGQYTTEIDLGEFIKLYTNHRPAFGLQPGKLEWAFQVLGFPTAQNYAIDRGELLDLLQNRGEHMTEYELAEYLSTLLGFNDEGGSSELQQFDTEQAGDLIDANLPQCIDMGMFANELLGFGMYGDMMNMQDSGSELGEMSPVEQTA